MRILFFLAGVFLLLPACGSQQVRVQGGREPAAEVMVKAMPAKGNVVDERHGKEVWFAIGPMNGTEATPANGVVMAHVFEDGAYLLTMQLNIAVAGEGFSYEAWLMGEKEGDLLSVGKLQSVFTDARHSLRFEAKQDLRRYGRIIVTLEPADGDTEPTEKLVAGGTLKEVRR